LEDAMKENAKFIKLIINDINILLIE